MSDQPISPSRAPRAISPLRQRMIEDMRLRNFSSDGQREYIRAVRKLAAPPQ